jgi:uncharacterized phage infection (PIP) family protein YhgE
VRRKTKDEIIKVGQDALNERQETIEALRAELSIYKIWHNATTDDFDKIIRMAEKVDPLKEWDGLVSNGVSKMAARIATLESQLSQAQSQVQKAADFSNGFSEGLAARTAGSDHEAAHDAEGKDVQGSGWEAGWEWMDDYIKARQFTIATALATAAETVLRRVLAAVGAPWDDDTNAAFAEAERVLAAVASGEVRQEGSGV